MALHNLTLHHSPENLSEQDRSNFGLHFYNLNAKIVRDPQLICSTKERGGHYSSGTTQ